MEMELMEESGNSTCDEKLEQLFVRLTRITLKYFYEPKDLLVVDRVIKEKYVTEKQLETVLKFDVKLLRVTLATLKNDKILHVKTESGVTAEGKRYINNYYFIKFRQLVNVIKYKLENVRNRLETLERDLSTKNSFVCAFCERMWTDMEAGELINLESLKFFCVQCGRPVVEDTTAIPLDTRQMVAKFNEQLGPIYDAIREIENAVENG